MKIKPSIQLKGEFRDGIILLDCPETTDRGGSGKTPVGLIGRPSR